jgi:hypothetical protein
MEATSIQYKCLLCGHVFSDSDPNVALQAIQKHVCMPVTTQPITSEPMTVETTTSGVVIDVSTS